MTGDTSKTKLLVASEEPPKMKDGWMKQMGQGEKKYKWTCWT